MAVEAAEEDGKDLPAVGRAGADAGVDPMEEGLGLITGVVSSLLAAAWSLTAVPSSFALAASTGDQLSLRMDEAAAAALTSIAEGFCGRRGRADEEAVVLVGDERLALKDDEAEREVGFGATDGA